MSHFADISMKLNSKISFLLICWLLTWGLGMAQSTQSLPDSVVVLDSTGQGSQTNSTEQSSSGDSLVGASTSQPDSLSPRTVPDSVLSEYRNDREFGYANDPAYWNRAADPSGNDFAFRLYQLFSSKRFRIFMMAILSLALLYALYKIIVENKLYLFYTSPRKKLDLAPDENEPEDLDLIISSSIAAGDFRNAVRYLHQKAIRTAGDNGKIHIQPRATNGQYINQLNNHPQKDNFQFLSQAHEHVWYGGFVLTAEQFKVLQDRFNQFFRHINI
jgi:hypothetical protein